MKISSTFISVLVARFLPAYEFLNLPLVELPRHIVVFPVPIDVLLRPFLCQDPLPGFFPVVELALKGGPVLALEDPAALADPIFELSPVLGA